MENNNFSLSQARPVYVCEKKYNKNSAPHHNDKLTKLNTISMSQK